MAEKLGIGVLCALLIAVAGLYRMDLTGGIPFVSAAPAPTTPAYVDAIATPAAIELPDVDIDAWFAEPEGEDGTDPYDPAVWGEVAAFVDASRTPGGWTETCGLATSATGGDRREAPLPGAMACSDIPSVTAVQQFAAAVLGVQAEVALWIRGVPGYGTGGIQARQGDVRLMCGIDVIAREGGPASTYGEACVLALDSSYMAGDGPGTFTAAGQAYALAAADIANRDATTDSAPGFYTTDAVSE